MRGLGTIINVVAVIIGGIGGMLFGKKLQKRFQDILMSASGICVIFLGIGGCMEEMLKIQENGLTTNGTMMMIGTFTLGALVGEVLNLERHMEEFGTWLKLKTGSQKDTSK